MLHRVDENFIARLQKFSRPAMRDDIERHRRTRRKDNLVDILRADKSLDDFASIFQLRRHPIAKLVDSAMDVRIVLLATFDQLVDHDAWLLRGGRRVEIDQRTVIQQPLIKNGKITPNGFDIERQVAGSSHITAQVRRSSCKVPPIA